MFNHFAYSEFHVQWVSVWAYSFSVGMSTRITLLLFNLFLEYQQQFFVFLFSTTFSCYNKIVSVNLFQFEIKASAVTFYYPSV